MAASIVAHIAARDARPWIESNVPLLTRASSVALLMMPLPRESRRSQKS
jgi:hypothetical protein